MAVGNGQSNGTYMAAPRLPSPVPPPSAEDFCDYKVPKHLQNAQIDPVAQYFRARYCQRHAFFQQQDEETQRKIRQEKNRIAKLKSIFASEETNKTTLEKLTKLKIAWKTSAKMKCTKNRQYVEQEFGNDLIGIGEDRIDRRKKNKLRVLGRVEATSWDDPVVEDDPKVEDDPIVGDDPVVGDDPMVGDNSIVQNNENIGTGISKPGYGFKMMKITLDRRPAQDPSVSNYKLERFSIDEATNPNSAKNPWKKDPATPDAIRYFHFPANDMEWIQTKIPTALLTSLEGAIKRYEEQEEQVSQKLLSRELWVGQQHGTLKDPIHARHMRPHCTLIPSDAATLPDALGSNNISNSPKKNPHLVLFVGDTRIA
ncbi:ankyrin repeat protein [Rutstroemia sp. NJR-2017a WRK4]|nr:ankyrin repeat protein [Rutstroemia sp. NJR-2017a WRK4]